MSSTADECKLFISYKHDARLDFAVMVQSLTEHVTAVANVPFRVMSDLDIAPGRHWRDEIIRLIQQCDVFCVLVPKEVSTQVAVECGMALGLGKPIFAIVKVENTGSLASYGLEYLQAFVMSNAAVHTEKKNNEMADLHAKLVRVICEAKGWPVPASIANPA